MAVQIGDLLRYKQKVDLRNNGNVIATVWVRVLGDYDLQLSYRLSRIASARMRAALRTPGSPEYQDEIAVVSTNNTREECLDLIKRSKLNTFFGEANAVINREDPPKIESIAVEPDAPTLEEQERLDKMLEDQNKDYDAKIKQYMEEHAAIFEAELAEKPDDEIFEMAKFEISNILALQEFQNEVQAQKIYWGTFNDEKCKVRAFADIDEYKNSHPSIKNQLIAAYSAVELAPDDVKN